MIFLFSCDQPEENKFDVLVFVTFDSNKTTSFKIAASDTLFRELKLLSFDDYSYSVLNKVKRKNLNDMVGYLKSTGSDERSFAIGANGNVLFMASDTTKTYYTSRIWMQNPDFKNVVRWFMRFQSDTSFKKVDKKGTFWNIDGMHEPPPPPIPVDSSKLVTPLTVGFAAAGPDVERSASTMWYQ